MSSKENWISPMQKSKIRGLPKLKNQTITIQLMLKITLKNYDFPGAAGENMFLFFINSSINNLSRLAL